MAREPASKAKSVFLASTAFCAIAIGSSPASAASGSTQYTYDALGRLLTATYDNGVQIQYQYDAAGNRTQAKVNTGQTLPGSPPPPPPPGSPPPPSPPPPPPPPPPTGLTCFPAGTEVEMADGHFVPIEQVKIGELVKGRYGEANPVLALDRPLLGKRALFRINGEHRTTGEHTHWTKDGPTAIDIERLYDERSTYHPVIVAGGAIEEWLFVGMTRPVTALEVGSLACYRDGFKEVARIEVCDPATAPPDLQLYNLVLGGSHTMRLDGYLVTGWPHETDFDYDAWRTKPGVHFVHPRRSITRAA